MEITEEEPRFEISVLWGIDTPTFMLLEGPQDIHDSEVMYMEVDEQNSEKHKNSKILKLEVTSEELLPSKKRNVTEEQVPEYDADYIPEYIPQYVLGNIPELVELVEDLMVVDLDPVCLKQQSKWDK